MKNRNIAVIGERNPSIRAHQGIEASLNSCRDEIEPGLNYTWVGTSGITSENVDQLLGDFSGIWCAPGSPYESTPGALLAIRHARKNRKPFLGTCGGFQHALMEYAANVLGHQAEHAETAPDATDPLIAKLSCSLVGASGRITAVPGDQFATLLGGPESIEGYHCNYGMNPALENIFAGSDLVFVAHDEQAQVRAFRLPHHPFFIGTLFQPERRIFSGPVHPLIRAFVRAG